LKQERDQEAAEQTLASGVAYEHDISAGMVAAPLVSPQIEAVPKELSLGFIR
jgi:hypothetical protein